MFSLTLKISWVQQRYQLHRQSLSIRHLYHIDINNDGGDIYIFWPTADEIEKVLNYKYKLMYTFFKTIMGKT